MKSNISEKCWLNSPVDIKLPILNLPSPAQPALGLNSLNLLDLKVGQTIDVKVLTTLVTTAQNTIALKLGNQLVNMQSSQPLNLRPDQALSIQVTQVTPSLEFKVLSSLAEATTQPLLLSLLPQAAPPPTKQQLQAKVIALSDTHIQLQIAPESSTTSSQRPATITIDRTSIPLTTEVVIGQQLALEITPSEKQPEYRLIANPDARIEAKLATLVKQLLPRQEFPNALLTQLHEELPQLISNPAVPQALKNIVSEILQNLPQREQVFDGNHLAKVINDSGIFLEAKLPLLIHTVSAGSLKEAIINLLQKLPQQITAQPTSTQQAPLQQPTAAQQSALPKTAYQETAADSFPDTLFKADLKANLGKLLLALKQEISNQEDLGINNANIDALKTLHQKTENSVAKIILEQLASLPREDSAKQFWQCNIVFMDQEYPQSAQLEIHLDKEQDPSINAMNWSVNITITPPGLGSIHCIVSCRDKVISTYFNTQQKASANLINDNLLYLKAQLEDQGLIVGQMTANEGNVKKSPEPGQPTGRKLFDDHA